MKLYYTKTSPYARKARIMAIEKGIDSRIDLIEISLAAKPQELFDTNPLGKIPALITDDGEVIVDSPVICEYLDKLAPKPKFIPGGKKRFQILTLSALADGLMESAVAILLENRRPPEKQLDTSVNKHRDDMKRTLEHLNKNVKKLKRLNMASVAVGAALGYIDFRHGNMNWRADYKKLAKWFDEFNQRPSLQATIPQG